MIFKPGQLVAILACSQATESKWIDSINAACTKYSINSRLRLAAFIAQVGHESARLTAVEENLNYSASGLLATFGKYFDSASAAAYARQPQKIGNRVYANRMGNGSEASGDGYTYRGRGLIQCTGKSTYNSCSQGIGIDVLNNPASLTSPPNAALSAGWFWNSRSLNDYADRSDFISITKKINGGTNGQADRQALYDRALIVLADGNPDDGKTVPDKTPDVTAPITTKNTPAATNSTISEPRPAAASVYPWNAVFESRSGHVTQVDDTPGNERLNMIHRIGSYWEIGPLGTYTQKSVLDAYKLTKGDSYEYTGGDYLNQTTGQSFTSSDGNWVLKSGSGVFIETPRVQMNTGVLAVSGDINAPSMNADIFTGPFGDILAKEAMLAWDLGHGSGGGNAPPVIGGTIGFSGSSVTQALQTNTLGTHAPNGTPITTNGVPSGQVPPTIPAVAGAAAAAAAAVINGSNTDISPQAQNAIQDAASNADAANTANNDTPILLKHISFDKPLLPSQSTLANVPDPKLYQNNLHMIVSDTGVGELYISDGNTWRGISSTDLNQLNQLINNVQGQVTQEVADRAAALLQEAQARTAQIAVEAQARSQALIDEANARNAAITSGLLAEATARGAAIQQESDSRQSADESLSHSIDTLTSGLGDASAAILAESTTRSAADSALASNITAVAAQVNGNTAAIQTEQTARVNADTVITDSITTLTATMNGNITAAVASEASARTTADSALGTRIDTTVAAVNSNSAAITNETTARTTADTALAQNITTLSAYVGNIRGGQNLLLNAGFTDTYTTGINNQLPTGYGLYNNTPTGETTVSNMVAGPDGYGAVRINWTGPNTTTKGILATPLFSGGMRAGIYYVLAIRARAVTNTVGCTISLAPTNNPYTSFTTISKPPLTTDWQWYIFVGMHGSIVVGEFFATIEQNVTNGIFDLATPIVQEGQVFNGFNLGNDYQVNVNAAVIQTEQTVRLTADTALGTRIDTVTASTNANQAAITAETTARTNADSALGSRIDTVSASVSANTASIVAESTARVSGDQANASSITSLTTTVGTNTANISTQQNSINGISANYGIKIDNNGYVAGFGLLSTPVNGVPISSFNILADKFSITKPSLNGGTPVSPFTIDTTTTPTTITFNGLVLINTPNYAPGSITSDKLVVGTGGGNKVFNSAPSPLSIAGFSIGYNSTGMTVQGPTPSFAPYFPAGGAGVYMVFPNLAPTGSCDLTNQNRGSLYTVLAGQRYEFSVYLSCHRSTADAAIVWIDANGAYITENHGSVVNTAGSGALSGFARSTLFATAPSNAATCYVMVRAYYTGQTSPYTFTSMWYFGEARVNQTEFSPWSATGVTAIDGGMIVTQSIIASQINVSSLSAISATIGLLRTATSGARLELSNNNLIVYDANNIARVTIGALP